MSKAIAAACCSRPYEQCRRFKLQGRDSFDAWIKGFMPDGAETTVVRTIPTVTGFVTEFAGRHQEHGEDITDRKILLAEVRGGRITELTVYCSGDWNAELRARHAAESQLIRPEPRRRPSCNAWRHGRAGEREHGGELWPIGRGVERHQPFPVDADGHLP